ncbi:MAG: UDP-N-acetylglucosamine 1-carboxyvinyltransferase [Clostridiales bacterium]|nr:UDP-N-acetylglucosamine 1-carboxyvinyltransferase [Clostridiales bacterium]
MEAFLIHGSNRIKGEYCVHNAKNAVLPIMAASILTEERTILRDCPDLSDIRNMADILRSLGCRVDVKKPEMIIDPQGLNSHEMPDGLAKKLRSSIFMLGPILARFRKAAVTFPGGCEIGLRPIDLHLRGLMQLNARVQNIGGVIHCDGQHMTAGNVHFDYPSVGATENIMMAAVLLKGKTVLYNAAREPEIIDLQNFLNAMGACVSGAGSNTIEIHGVKRLKGIDYVPMPDRIVAGTLLAAAAVTRGSIRLTNAPVEEIMAVITKLEEMGCIIRSSEKTITLHAPEKLSAFSQLQTQPYPGFPTDMQAQMMAISTLAKETSVVVENVFENRFAHAGDLNRMGARILLNGRTAVIHGVDKLHGTTVTARDLRGGAALTIAGLAAEGQTIVEHAELIDRGYDHLEDAFCALGCDVRRITLP